MSPVGDRMIDRWFPCLAVDEAVQTTIGSGRNEKALFPWFASRPLAQARAAVIAALLPDRPALRPLVDMAIRVGDHETLTRLAEAICEEHGGPPAVLDPFSGRGIIPLEAARLGVRGVGLDYSPVATLAGRLLADYPLRDWAAEPGLPFDVLAEEQLTVGAPRLASDVASVLAEVGRRVKRTVAGNYLPNRNRRYPWGYLWAITIPCEGCGREFPLIGSLTLRHPYKRTDDPGQAIHLLTKGDSWSVDVIDGVPEQVPTLASQPGRKGSIGRCPFPCKHSHSLEILKRKGFAGQYADALIAVADNGEGAKKVFRAPRAKEVAELRNLTLEELEPFGRLPAVPTELIPSGNFDTVRPSAYGATNYGQLMNTRQTLLFVETARAIRSVHQDLLGSGISTEYAEALAAYAAGNLARCVKHATRGAKLRAHGNRQGTGQNRVQIDHIYSGETKVSFEFDYFEAGLGSGPGTWASLAETLVGPLEKHQRTATGRPARCVRGSAMALPYRDMSVQAVVTDPPYDAMMDYSDASDVLFVWLKRALADIDGELFRHVGVQDKDEEIIVKRGRTDQDHRTEAFYERALGEAFAQTRRVLTGDGTLTVIFAHTDPAAWVRLLSALHEAGFVVSSSWPSRTESGNTGVSSINVTVAIGCRVAPAKRNVATAAQVDREARDAIAGRVVGWEADGLALPDQLMASYGPAMEVYGRYSRVVQPDGEEASIERYLVLARAAVREAHKMKLDTIPLETFDAVTRFAVFWMRSYGRSGVPKGEATFSAQADGLRIGDVRRGLLTESRDNFRLTLEPPEALDGGAPVFDVVRAMASAWGSGGLEAVADVLRKAERSPDDEHVWAVVSDLSHHLPDADPDARLLTALLRNAPTIKAQAASWQTAMAKLAVKREEDEQLNFADL